MKQNSKIKRLGFDARFYGPSGKGLGRYTQEIVNNILSLDKLNQYVIFLSSDNFDELEISPENQNRVKKILFPARWYTLKEQILFPFYIWREGLDLMHFLHFNVPVLTPIKFVVTIHDLILTKFPTPRATTLSPALYALKQSLYNLTIKTALRRAQKVIAISQFTKDDIVANFKINPDKIAVVYNGVSDLKVASDSAFIKKIELDSVLSPEILKAKFLLYVGNAYPHKNLERLLAVFKKLLLSEPETKLILVGKSDYFYERLKGVAIRLGLYQADKSDNPVSFPGYVSDAELQVLFARAQVYVFPSLYEGFGFPPLEAMGGDCPVVSSNASSLPEVLGEAAYYFNPLQESEMLEAIKRVMIDEDLRRELIARGRIRRELYKWPQAATATWQIYRQILNF